MSTIIERPGSRYEGGQMTRRDLFLSLSAMALAPARVMGQSRSSVLPIQVTSWSHSSFHPNVSNLMWYQRVFGMPIMYHQAQPGTGGWPILKVGDGPSYLGVGYVGPFRPAREPLVSHHFSMGIRNFNLDRIMRALSEMGVKEGGTGLRDMQHVGTPEPGFVDLDGNRPQFMDESCCGGGGYLGDLCDYSAKAIRLPGDPPPIAVQTLNHCKIGVRNLQRTIAWYQKLTDMKLVTYQELEGGPRTAGYEGGPVAILQFGAGPQHLALTEGIVRPHFGFGIKGFDVSQIMKRLAEHGVPARVRMREGVTPEVLLEDPEGLELQLQDVSYCGGGGVLGNVCDPRQRPFPGSV